LREIGIIGPEDQARALADYLLTLDISTQLVARADGGWTVWVHKEDRVPRAREILDEFARDPSDPRFRSAAPAALEIRAQDRKVQADYRKRVRDFRDRWEGHIYHRAPLTVVLAVSCVVVTALVHSRLDLGGWAYRSLRFSTPGFVEGREVLDTGLARIRHGEVWRLVTPIFLHGGLAHLFFNVLALVSLGDRIEFRKGTWRLAGFVLVTAVASNLGQFAKSGGNFGGISGVVFAMAGYLWVKGHHDPDDGLSLDQRSMTYILGWFLLGIAFAELGPPGVHEFPYNMANVAHGVGLASGMALGLLRL
jgi:GlpG protein